ncbi:carbohydrate-binding WSC [Pochonia chlamydosporia 170]|uniref:Carbohydrate-binding WSC n=1 Tax=Pochonia chlamydosporia 170 TaxID=1380566 RepID=A0A179EZ87_METCM|nr:carbohydrate-binding WSC [Pochonia chlamydosporia 170]OAQ58517.1 carbohydrate-binding WSC [Pochonia chlamydosporia 170]
MSRAALAVVLIATGAAAQANFASDGFQYVGCVQASTGVFPVKMNLGDSFTVAQCQEACGKSGAYAAAAGNGCHCDNPISHVGLDFDVMDDSKCSQACKPGDAKAGQCGGPISTDGQQLYNLYQRISTDPIPANVTLPPIANKAVDLPTSTFLKTITTCPPGVTDCPLHSTSEDPQKPCTKEHPPPPPPPPPPVKTKFALPCPESKAAPPPPSSTTPCDCEETKKPAPPPNPCPGPDCMETTKTEMPPPTSKAAPATTSEPVIVSEGSSRPISAVMVVLSVGALVLAMGMS